MACYKMLTRSAFSLILLQYRLSAANQANSLVRSSVLRQSKSFASLSYNRFTCNPYTSPFVEKTTCKSVPKLDGHQERYYCEKKRQLEVSFEELQALSSSGNIQLIDVREPNELVEYGAIPGAVNIPLGSLKGALNMSDEAFQEHYKCDMPQKYNRHIVFYGLGPIKSTAALELAFKLGFKKARHYKGGWEDYALKTGQPLMKSAQNS